jgi:hypothetical protein
MQPFCISLDVMVVCVRGPKPMHNEEWRFQQARLRVPLHRGTLVGLIQVKKRDCGEEWTMPTEIPFLIGEIHTDRTLG